jgi:hypothetical protein
MVISEEQQDQGRERFKTLVKAMRAVYAKPDFIPDRNAFDIWYHLLKDIDYPTLEAAIIKHMQTSSYVPTIADIREKAAELKPSKGRDLGELEAWGMVRKAIERSSYYAEDEFAKLPEIVQLALGDPAMLREWASMPTDQVDSVAMSQFLRSFRSARERTLDDERVSPNIVNLAESARRKFTVLPQKSEDQKPPLTVDDSDDYIPMPEELRRRMGLVK